MHVVKLGGSLLTLPELGDRLIAAIVRLKLIEPLVVVGGGAAADHVRRLQIQHGLSSSAAHWLAIEAMLSNAMQLRRLDRRLTVVHDRRSAQAAWESGQVALLNPVQFMRDEQATVEHDDTNCPSECIPLPHSWSVTSDSIAAWVAARWPSTDLWLFKSRDAMTTDPLQMARRGLVDDYFPTALAADCRVHWINLRSDD